MNLLIIMLVLVVSAIIICFRNVVNTDSSAEAAISTVVGIVLIWALVIFLEAAHDVGVFT